MGGAQSALNIINLHGGHKGKLIPKLGKHIKNTQFEP
jgi:hypothetical protein